MEKEKTEELIVFLKELREAVGLLVKAPKFHHFRTLKKDELEKVYTPGDINSFPVSGVSHELIMGVLEDVLNNEDFQKVLLLAMEKEVCAKLRKSKDDMDALFHDVGHLLNTHSYEKVSPNEREASTRASLLTPEHPKIKKLRERRERKNGENK